MKQTNVINWLIKSYIAIFLLHLLSIYPSQFPYNQDMQLPDNLVLTFTSVTKQLEKKEPKKDWTFITYMSADNDLAHFARKNLAQQADIGSNKNINIVTQLDTRAPGNKKITKRYFVKKGKVVITNHNEPHSQKMDSGDPETLIDCCKWAIKDYPAHNYALILWNHGTGIIDIGKPRSLNPSELFVFNPANNLIELDRNKTFFEFIKEKIYEDEKGICFDDSTGHYLTNQKLEYALKTICKKFLHGKKFSIIGFDACLMSMVEVANIVRDYTHVMVSSQEVELGTGWDYRKVLLPFITQSVDKIVFGQYIVTAYEQTYAKITNDYTQSALDLTYMGKLEQNINDIAFLLIECLKRQSGNSVRDAIKTSRHKLLCTHFDEPSYIDLNHFYINILTNLKRFQFKSSQEGKKLKKEIHQIIEEGIRLIRQIVIANTVGKNLSQAKGISIYFPERRIHNSYRNTKFAATNKWPTFLHYYLIL